MGCLFDDLQRNLGLRQNSEDDTDLEGRKGPATALQQKQTYLIYALMQCKDHVVVKVAGIPKGCLG